MKFSIGFVIYNPDKLFIARIESIINAGYQVFIFDNSIHHNNELKNLEVLEGMKYYSSGKNLGLGIGLSFLCYNAYNNNFKSLLFFDQDTSFTFQTLNFISKFIETNESNFDLFSAIQFCNKNIPDTKELGYVIKNKDLIISSGSLFNLKNLKKLNWHSEKYFVDGVDYEFCLNSNNNNFLLGICDNTPDFDHVSGQADKPYLLFGKKLMLRAYNKNRITDSFSAYLKLIFQSVVTFNLKYVLLFIKSFMIYIYYQILVRILNLFK